MRPNTRFTWSDGFAIAYQVVGDGAHDLVYLPGYMCNVDISWDVPPIARFLEDLSAFSRLVLLDRRGVGCSDRYTPDASPPLEEMADDVLAVMDAVNSRSATLFAVQDAAFIAMMLAASAPTRVSSLVLFGAAASWVKNDEMPWELSTDEWTEIIAESTRVESAFERADGYIQRNLPSLAGDPGIVQRLASLMLTNQSPGALVAEFDRLRDVDVRDILPTIQAPTLILHRTDDPVEPIDSGRHLAAHIAGARLVELEGGDTQPWAGDTATLLKEIEAFVTGAAPSNTTAAHLSGERILATVLFTDIVGSTQRVAEMGDGAWRALIIDHERRSLEIVARYRGVFDHTTGDGLMARFDGPARAIGCARDLVAMSRELGVEIRAGAHAGEVELTDSGAHGVAVHVAARVAVKAGASEVWASSTVKDLTAGSGLVFEDAGEHELKGVPDRWRLYKVVGS